MENQGKSHQWMTTWGTPISGKLHTMENPIRIVTPGAKKNCSGKPGQAGFA